MTHTNSHIAAYLTKINATEAVRFGAEGPNNNLRRGGWVITAQDGSRPAKSHEARALNKMAVPGFGSRTLTA
jgi:hypothetical protein